MRNLGFLILLMPLLIIQACAPKVQDDCGFIQNVYGERVSWKSSVPITLELHESVPEQYVPSILTAVRTWEENAGRKLFKLNLAERVKGPRLPQKDGRNVIYFMDQWETNRLREQGRTNLYSVGDEIREADIRINFAGEYSFYVGQGNGVSMDALMIHEVGHMLGLKHRDDGNSVMATYLADNTDRVALGAADTASLSCEY